MKNEGNLFVIAAPSGTGKTTLVNALLDNMSHITVSISHTTRPKRSGEKDGVNYYFITQTEFEHMVAHHDFLEYATIFDHLYGTSKTWVQKTLAEGKDVILEIDWQGQQQIKKLFPQMISIFILPPSLAILQERLTKRNQDHPDIIKKRLADAFDTLSHLPEFDYAIVNDEFCKAENELKLIIEASRLLTTKQIGRFAELIESFKL